MTHQQRMSALDRFAAVIAVLFVALLARQCGDCRRPKEDTSADVLQVRFAPAALPPARS